MSDELEVKRSARCTSITTTQTAQAVSESIHLGLARMLAVDPAELPADMGRTFTLTRGPVEYARGIRMRTFVKARGDVRPLPRGCSVMVRFWPHWESIAWLTVVGSFVAIALLALATTVVTGSGPLLWPIGSIILFGAFCHLKVRTLQRARREVEEEMLSWLRE